jgi:hypothetical protein
VCVFLFKKNVYEVILILFVNSIFVTRLSCLFAAERDALHAAQKAEKKIQMREKVISFFSFPMLLNCFFFTFNYM